MRGSWSIQRRCHGCRSMIKGVLTHCLYDYAERSPGPPAQIRQRPSMPDHRDSQSLLSTLTMNQWWVSYTHQNTEITMESAKPAKRSASNKKPSSMRNSPVRRLANHERKRNPYSTNLKTGSQRIWDSQLASRKSSLNQTLWCRSR